MLGTQQKEFESHEFGITLERLKLPKSACNWEAFQSQLFVKIDDIFANYNQ